MGTNRADHIRTNWKTWNETSLDIVAGITLHHLPGHTPGLAGMQINLPEDGSFVFVSSCFLCLRVRVVLIIGPAFSADVRSFPRH